VVGGAVLAKDPAALEELTWWANCLGLTGSPFDSYQTLRGLRTLSVRYRQHEENAAAVAEFLERQQMVRKVYYPGLRSHNGHGLAKRQQQSFGAMISFEIAADVEEIGVFLGNLRLFTLAESLGGVESLHQTKPVAALGRHRARGRLAGRPGCGLRGPAASSEEQRREECCLTPGCPSQA
jgi:cystathionine gamma-synthase